MELARLEFFGDKSKPRGLANPMKPGTMERPLPIVSNGIINMFPNGAFRRHVLESTLRLVLVFRCYIRWQVVRRLTRFKHVCEDSSTFTLEETIEVRGVGVCA